MYKLSGESNWEFKIDYLTFFEEKGYQLPERINYDSKKQVSALICSFSEIILNLAHSD